MGRFDSRMRGVACAGACVATMVPAGAASAAEGAGFDDEIVVVAPSPGAHARIPIERLPFVVQSTDADALARAQSTDLTDYLGTHLGSVSVNAAQNNPLQPDLQFRGYTASPLLGLAQGIAVFQNGARINEPLGDAVNWDLVPQSAINGVSLVGGSNPLFGLNTLGGALSIEMKNGFNYQGHEVEASGGAWGRNETSAQSGGNNGTFGYYVDVDYFDEDGWRDRSPTNAVNVYGAASYRATGRTLDLSVQHGSSDLTGNGPAPLGLLARSRSDIFTAPDITDNAMTMVNLNGAFDVTSSLKLGGTGFFRDNQTGSFNGDTSNYQGCALQNGQFLLGEIEQSQLDSVGLSADQVCADNVLAAANPAALETALNALLPPGAAAFNLHDLTPDLTGGGALSDEAINNRSRRDQQSYGVDVQGTYTGDLFGRGNFFTVGGGWARGEARFDSTTELALLDPITRVTAGLGTFVSTQATHIDTRNATWSAYFLDAWQLFERFTLTAGGRWNDTRVHLGDRSGVRPELDGDHHYTRFNPTVGATYDIADHNNVYASYSESSRAPTPIELACNDRVFDRARAAAIARGDDPDDVEFECRLPNAFLADPPLEQVVAKSVEFGVRGTLGVVQHRLGYFRTENRHDIIFQTTGRGTGLFANVDGTLREGFESAFAVSMGKLDYAMAYSYVRATFDDDFRVLSPNHPRADAAGEVAVRAGSNMPGIPEHQFKFSADYAFPWDIRGGVEVQVFSSQYLRGDEANLLKPLGGYALVNLRAAHAVNRHIEVFARVTNLFDTDYENFGLVGEDPTEVIAGLTDARAIYAGAGAPRAGWVGVRLRM